MPLSNILRAGSNRIVARRVALGDSDGEILLALREAFPGERSDVYQTALAYGKQAAAAGSQYDDNTYDYPAFESLVPRVSRGAKSWRYYALVEVRGIDDNVRTARYVQVTKADQLSRDSLIAEISDRFEELFPSQSASPKSVPVPENFEIVEVSIISVERVP